MGKGQVALYGVFERALGEIQTRVSASGITTPAIAIAYSGGLDSSVLLHLAQRYANERRVPLFAFHIHHGISANANDWLVHCESECKRLGVQFDARRITLSNREKGGLEEAARVGRYAALGELCRLHDVHFLLTAHHQDDQAETVLLQLLRGSGIAGLAGMEMVNRAPILLGSGDVMMARPLLPASRTDLEEYARGLTISYIDDESNTDTRYARNALRHRVMPVLEEFFPGGRGRIARAAQHAQSAQRLLNELAAQDLERCAKGECLDLERLKSLSSDRIDNVLRYWFASCGVRMPATSWMSELREQLFDAKEDAQLCVTHLDCHVRRHRNRIFLVPRREDDASMEARVEFRWSGQAQAAFAEFRGSLYFESAVEGFDANWLREQVLTLRYRQGGENLKLAFNRPTRSLKQHYQALDIPAWQRKELPLLSTGEKLLFAAGIGMDCRHFATNDGIKIRCQWRFDDE